MSVSEIMIALYGAYEPTGVYSFEFRKMNGNTITEIFFMLPPESVSVLEPQRSALMATLKGGYYVDFGQEFKEIKISGSTHFYYAGTTKSPSKEYGSSNNIGVVGYLDGYTEFIKLRFMISRYRDYTMTHDGKLNAPDFAAQEVATVNALKQHVMSSIENGDGALADNLDVIWHDYDYDDHFKVRVDSLNMSREKGDPWTVKYDISLIGYEVDTRKAGRIQIKQPTHERKQTPPQLLRSVYLMTGEMHEYTKPESVTVIAPGTAYEVTNYATSMIENPPTHVDI